jgi:glyoxylase-like metal-dependent hydrolase (beta-lactamase superfamily II)
MMLKVHVGGLLATNGYWFAPSGESPKGICFDAPEGMADFLADEGLGVHALVLTHGHFDHIWDAAEIRDRHQCPVYIHPADAPLVRNPGGFVFFGIEDKIPPVADVRSIEIPDRGEGTIKIEGTMFTAFHIPGHSRGSVVFYRPEEGFLIGGDVLFASGIGRTDLPGGSYEALIGGIRTHLMQLPDGTKVFPGHGGTTTVGEERLTNPYLRPSPLEKSE